MDGECLARTALPGRDIAKTGMLVVGVVPVNEIGVPRACLFERFEKRRITHGVFQGLVPRLDMGIVVAAARAGIAPCDLQGVEEDSQGHSAHGVAVIGVDDLGDDAQIPNDALEQPAGVLVRLVRLDRPSDNRPVVQVDDGVGVEKQAMDTGSEPRDVPRPHLVGADNLDMVPRGCRRRFLGFLPMPQRTTLAEDAI